MFQSVWVRYGTYADLQDKQETQLQAAAASRTRSEPFLLLLLLFASGLLRIYSTATRKSKIPGTPASVGFKLQQVHPSSWHLICVTT